MFEEKKYQCKDRIISIFQLHVRPIVRGESKNPTEFGAKIGAAVYEGYTFIDHHSWDAYNESSDLSLQIQLFKKRFGYLPYISDFSFGTIFVSNSSFGFRFMPS